MKPYLLILTILLAIGASQSYARQTATFGPKESEITGSIRYSVIGQYIAHCNAFRGQVTLDQKSPIIQSVNLDIDTNSFSSNCPWCDKIARSRKLLYTTRYPRITFKSDEIVQDQEGYKVKGILVMHGIRRRMTFPFNVGVVIDHKNQQKWLVLKGSWRINRKDFNIVWNKFLDRGGFVVGNIFTVNWWIKLSLKS